VIYDHDADEEGGEQGVELKDELELDESENELEGRLEDEVEDEVEDELVDELVDGRPGNSGAITWGEGDDQRVIGWPVLSLPEPIPERQEDINKQADAAIRDLFPRIPDTDCQMIIEHAFNKVGAHPTRSHRPSGSRVLLEVHSLILNLQSKLNKGEPPVGLIPRLTLSRRTQLAVLAHIRHTHTRYDQLLRETTFVNARQAVEPLCLEIMVRWRGDEG
jgi:hypothetical protein